jgi:hypothetical protein
MIEFVFEELHKIGMVRSRTQFSKEWLGMEGSYMRGLQAKHRQPSVRVIATCAVNLRRASDLTTQNKLPIVKAFSEHLQHLAQRCLDEILQNSAQTC